MKIAAQEIIQSLTRKKRQIFFSLSFIYFSPVKYRTFFCYFHWLISTEMVLPQSGRYPHQHQLLSLIRFWFFDMVANIRAFCPVSTGEIYRKKHQKTDRKSSLKHLIFVYCTCSTNLKSTNGSTARIRFQFLQEDASHWRDDSTSYIGIDAHNRLSQSSYFRRVFGSTSVHRWFSKSKTEPKKLNRNEKKKHDNWEQILYFIRMRSSRLPDRGTFKKSNPNENCTKTCETPSFFFVDLEVRLTSRWKQLRARKTGWVNFIHDSTWMS